jgi:hypothetical protein
MSHVIPKNEKVAQYLYDYLCELDAEASEIERIAEHLSDGDQKWRISKLPPKPGNTGNLHDMLADLIEELSHNQELIKNAKKIAHDIWGSYDMVGHYAEEVDELDDTTTYDGDFNFYV